MRVVMKGAPPALTDRFLAAFALASEVHGHDRRTGTEIPYLAHLLIVTGLAIEDGGDQDVADFMLKQVASNEYVHRIPAIAY
jgi:hypothetical protein